MTFESKTKAFPMRLIIKALNTMINEENKSSGQQDKETQANRSNVIKRPEDWTTGDEEMTGAQRSYLKTLGEEFNENLTKAEASKRKIDELQHKTGRGLKE